MNSEELLIKCCNHTLICVKFKFKFCALKTIEMMFDILRCVVYVGVFCYFVICIFLVVNEYNVIIHLFFIA